MGSTHNLFTEFRSTGRLLLLIVSLLVSGSILQAQPVETEANLKADNIKRDEARKPQRSVPAPLTVEQEEAALTFAREHHAELAQLVVGLKAASRPEYQQAVRDLFRASERLGRMREKLADRYESELELWKIDSRVRLLAARLTMGESDGLREELLGLLRKKREIRVAMLTAQQERLEKQVSKVEEELAVLQSDYDEAAERDLERLLKSAKGKREK